MQGCGKETAACLQCKCKAGCGHNGCAALGRCRETKCQKTRKVNWNRRRWHLVNPASGLLQIKSILNKSPEHLTFWEVDVELSACLSGNILLILAQLREKKKLLFFQDKLEIPCLVKIYCLRKSSLPPPQTPIACFQQAHVLHSLLPAY